LEREVSVILLILAVFLSLYFCLGKKIKRWEGELTKSNIVVNEGQAFGVDKNNQMKRSLTTTHFLNG